MMSNIKENDVVINKNMIGNIAAGTRGSIVYVYDEQSHLFEVEFVDGEGGTLGVLTVHGADLMVEET